MGLLNLVGRWLQEAAIRPGRRRNAPMEAPIKGPLKATFKASIMALPDEILLLVLDEVSLHDKFLLSQTCSTMRRIASCDWGRGLDQLSLAEKFDFWTGLAYVLSDHFVCANCCRLHRVHRSDLSKSRPRRCYVRKHYMQHHQVQHHQVQLALKYHRLGDTHQEYLQALLAPWTVPYHPSLAKYSARPKIVRNRYILQEEWTLFNDGDPVSKESLGRDSVVLCPHLVFIYDGYSPWSPQEQRPGIEFSDKISRAFDRPGEEEYHHCRYCPTDYLIVVIDPGSVRFTAWHDFGPHGSPLDLQWTTHDWSDKLRPSKIPKLRHIPGSVYELYMADEGENLASENE